MKVSRHTFCSVDFCPNANGALGFSTAGVTVGALWAAPKENAGLVDAVFVVLSLAGDGTSAAGSGALNAKSDGLAAGAAADARPGAADIADGGCDAPLSLVICGEGVDVATMLAGVGEADVAEENVEVEAGNASFGSGWMSCRGAIVSVFLPAVMSEGPLADEVLFAGEARSEEEGDLPKLKRFANTELGSFNLGCSGTASA